MAKPEPLILCPKSASPKSDIAMTLCLTLPRPSARRRKSRTSALHFPSLPAQSTERSGQLSVLNRHAVCVPSHSWPPGLNTYIHPIRLPFPSQRTENHGTVNNIKLRRKGGSTLDRALDTIGSSARNLVTDKGSLCGLSRLLTDRWLLTSLNGFALSYIAADLFQMFC